MSSLVDATAALSVTDERPDALAPAPPTCVPSHNSHSSPPGIAAARVTRRRFDAEPGVHIKLDKRGDGVAPVEGDTVQVNYSGRVKGKKTEFVAIGVEINQWRTSRRWRGPTRSIPHTGQE